MQLLKVLLVILVSTNFIFGQYDFKPGYLITNQNDTLTGYIDYTEPYITSQFCNFRQFNTSKTVSYSPDSILGYGFQDSKVFVTKSIEHTNGAKKHFLEYLVNGKLNLFYLGIGGDNRYFLEKDSTLYPLTNDKIESVIKGKRYWSDSKSYIGTMQWIMEDAKILRKELKDAEFTHQSLSNITEKYHYEVCEDQDCIVYLKEEKRLNDVKWKVGFGLGLQRTNSKLKIASNTSGGNLITNRGKPVPEFQNISSNTNMQFKSTFYSPEVFVNFSRNNRFNIQLGASYESFQQNEIDFKMIKVPLSLKFDLWRYNKVIPFINIGLLANYNFESRFSETQFVYFEEVVLDNATSGDSEYVRKKLTLEDVIFNKGTSLLPFFGAGLKLNTFNNQNLKIEFVRKKYRVKGQQNTIGPYVNSELFFTDNSLILSYSF